MKSFKIKWHEKMKRELNWWIYSSIIVGWKLKLAGLMFVSLIWINPESLIIIPQIKKALIRTTSILGCTIIRKKKIVFPKLDFDCMIYILTLGKLSHNLVSSGFLTKEVLWVIVHVAMLLSLRDDQTKGATYKGFWLGGAYQKVITDWSVVEWSRSNVVSSERLERVTYEGFWSEKLTSKKPSETPSEVL